MAGAHRRLKVDIRSHRQNALPLEPRAAHAAWDAASGRITLTCATQMPHAMRTIIADYSRKDSTKFWLNTLLALSMAFTLVLGTYVLLTFDANIS